MPKLTDVQMSVRHFAQHLRIEEKSRVTMDKYMRDVKKFALFLDGQEISKEAVIAYKSYLLSYGYKVASVNSMLASVNAFLTFLDMPQFRVKSIRVQRKTYASVERELSKGEYQRLLKAAVTNPRLHLVLETICATGIRVSELRYFTVEAVCKGEVTVSCKSKTRSVLIPTALRKHLLRFAREQKIETGGIFVTSGGKPLDCSNIWMQMKHLCETAKVDPRKVFPHNLRKLFARCFYAVSKDIAKLADILGHSNIDTTRIYIMTTGEEHRRQLERLCLIV